MAPHVCPWWIGYLLASPIRRWLSDSPESILAPCIRPGMIVLEPGPGMGYFTLPMARIVGSAGRIIAIDIQPKMLAGLRRRARKAGLLDRIELRLAKPDRMGLDDLGDAADFALAFAVVHETPSPAAFFGEIAAALKPGALLLFAEPAGHVKPQAFESELEAAKAVGLVEISRPTIRRTIAAVLKKI